MKNPKVSSYSWYVISRRQLGGRQYFNKYRKEWTTRRTVASRFGTVEQALAYISVAHRDTLLLTGQNLQIVKFTSTETTRQIVTTRVTSQKVG